jgi:hypothetical protein
MRNIMTREFFVPRESQGRTNIEQISQHDGLVYTYETAKGQLGAMAFHGKQAKPDWHFSFRNSEQRAKRIAEFFEARASRAKMMTEIKQRRTTPHTLKVGDILSCSWGYDQTNVDYYQVTRVPGANTVEIREIKKRSSGEVGFMTAHCSPEPDAFCGEPMVKRADAGNCVRIASYAVASMWDGKEDRYSWYA